MRTLRLASPRRRGRALQRALQLAAIASASLPVARAATAELPQDFVPLEDLLATRIDTATIREESWVRQPATLTLLRSEEIGSLGARSLPEALDFVPGMAHGVDVFGVNSLIVRGHWAQEGKVLLLYDDLPLNDLLYGSLNLGRHYPTDQMDRIEVLRGAGMAKYGGNAQLAVIRMQSKTPDRTGLTLDGGTEYVEGGGVGWEATATGAWVKEEVSLSLSGHLGQLPYSGEAWRDTGGTVWDLGETTGLTLANALFKADWRDLHVRLLYDRHLSESPQKFGYGVQGEEVLFQNLTCSACYDLALGESLTLTPKVTYRTQEDWFIDRDAAVNPVVDFFLPAQFIRGSLEAKTSWGEFDFQAGGEYWSEWAQCESPGGLPGRLTRDTYFAGRDSVSYDGAAAYLQGDWGHGPWLATAGARYSHHSYAGDSLVPRASASYARDQWYLKGIVGQAFREPDIEVINAADPASGPIQPETTTQLELEFGWTPTRRILGTVAVFDLEIDDPIIYASVAGPSGADYYYSNLDTVRTRGVETDWRLSLAPMDLLFGYSFYAGEPISFYAVPQDDQALIGAPRHKAYVSADLELGAPEWHLLASLVWYGSLYAADYDPTASDAQGNPLSVRKLDDQFLANLAVRYQKKSWAFTLGIRDIFDSGRVLAQPYHGESTPYPAAGRSVFLALSKSWQ